MSAFVVSRKCMDQVVAAILAGGGPFAGVLTHTKEQYGAPFPYAMTSASTLGDDGAAHIAITPDSSNVVNVSCSSTRGVR